MEKLNKETLNENNLVKSMDELKENKAYQLMKQMCEKHGYHLVNLFHRAYDNTSFIYSTVEIIADKDKYRPSIRYEQTDVFSDEYTWRIDTISYGSLTLEKYDVFLSGCKDAHNLVKELSNINPIDWPWVKSEE